MALSAHQSDVAEAMEIVRQEFGEDVILHGVQDATVKVKVDEYTDISASDESAEYETTFRLPEADLSKVGSETVTATINGRVWHVTKVGKPRYGFVMITVRSRFQDNTHSNQFDLKEEQATWNE